MKRVAQGRGETMQGFEFGSLGILLLLAALVAMICQRLRLPYSVGLVGAGVGLALLAPHSVPPLTATLIFYVFLPPLVFEAAIQIPWKPLRREIPLLAALITIGLTISASVVAAGMHWWAGWSWIGAGLFGVLIAATDPVSVIATFKTIGAEPRLHLLVEAESLLNDGVAAVGFAVLAGIATGGSAAPGAIALQLVWTAVGGVACGFAVAVPLIMLVGRTQDRLVEITLSWLIAFGSFLIAQRLGASGVLATLTAGLIVGNWGLPGWFTDEGQAGMFNHWEFVAFLINSVIFLLIGGSEAAMPLATVLKAASGAVVLALIGRAAGVYPVVAAFVRSRRSVPSAYAHVLVWGGLRGALALALALALPPTIRERGEIIVAAFAVVAFSIVVQGLSVTGLMRRLGLLGEEQLTG